MSLFSIIIPAYNQPRLLERAIGSILRQDMNDYEIIITDDSTNGEIRLCVENLNVPQIIYLRHEPTGHAVDNWNFGLQQASGQYIILMHHDEAMVGSNYLSRTRQLLDQGTDIVISDIEVVHDKKKASHLTAWMKKTIIAHPEWLFLINAIGPCACITFRREQTIEFCNSLEWLVDVEWYYRLLTGKKTVFTSECQMQSFHGHATQLSCTLNVRKSCYADKLILQQKYKDNLKVRWMIILYEHLIVRTKIILGMI